MSKLIFRVKNNKIMFLLTLIGLFISLDPVLSEPKQAQTVFDKITLSPQFNPDPTTLEGVSGGSIQAREITKQTETPTGPCLGFINRQPDHQITLTAFFNYLSVMVDSKEDTTIIVQGPGGTWCNDDYNGKNPGIAGQWQAGSYKIWIGSYKANAYNPYTVRISQVR